MIMIHDDDDDDVDEKVKEIINDVGHSLLAS